MPRDFPKQTGKNRSGNGYGHTLYPFLRFQGLPNATQRCGTEAAVESAKLAEVPTKGRGSR